MLRVGITVGIVVGISVSRSVGLSVGVSVGSEVGSVVCPSVGLVVITGASVAGVCIGDKVDIIGEELVCWFNGVDVGLKDDGVSVGVSIGIKVIGLADEGVWLDGTLLDGVMLDGD